MVTPLVSVVLPTYNRAQLLPRAISSVLAQSHSKFELIIVDDGSVDNTADVVSEFSDPRIVFRKLETNQGAPHARNVGIEISRGEFLAFLDSDDEWRSEKLAKQVQLFSESQSVGAVGAGISIQHRAGKEFVTKHFIPTKRIGNIQRELLSGRSFPGKPLWPGSTSSIMIRRECFDKVGPFDENLRCAQEHDLYIRLSRFFDFAAVPEVLVIRHCEAKERLSTGWDGQVLGKRRFLEKYQTQFPVFSRLKGNFAYHLGVRLIRDGHMVEGRRYLVQAVVSCPTRLRYWYHLTRSLLLPKTGYQSN